ncbi:hypothetical protein AC579_4636 [Pseudocercospora musae]|uniref:Mid2 domain-containing protein n=1 Tax=Pseudocercospora musae TaxID=113226 RepID=A0A139IB50_9PEZI|nr:hypothetical protein AC579_4636 [Pseudocercospora musae]KXT11998.1 hypothetical protein AC579_4636 [Pseudocercospora musae]
MSLACSFRRALLVAILTVSRVHAQQCFYPDGTLSSDTPCITGSDSSCCAASSFCMDNGLCFGSGIVSRGSCTDKTWQSGACASYCTTKSPGSSIPLTPCAVSNGASTFVCGLDGTACKKNSNTFPMAGGASFVLREAQVAAMVAPVLASMSASASASPNSSACTSDALYTGGQMAGLGIGLAIPLLIAACAVIFLWQKERARKPRLMYQLPDDDFKSPQALRPAVHFIPASRDNSDACSFRTVTPEIVQISGRATPQYKPDHLQSFQERYHAMNKNLIGLSIQAQELDGHPVGSAFNSRQQQQPIALQNRSPNATRPQRPR